MTVSTTTSTAQFEPNGVTINFPFAFRFFAATDLKVFWQKPDGTIQLLVLNSNYTVQGAGNDAGGSITTIGTPLPNGLLVVSRIMVATQLTSFRNQGEFFAEIHEDAFDKLVMLVQQTIDSQSRGLTVPIADPLTISLVLPSAGARAGKALAFDEQGQPVTSSLTIEQIEQQPALALESAAAAALSATNAGLSEVSAASSRDLAQKWASNPEDTPVVPGAFSAFHWAAKAFASAAAAAATLANAVSKVGAQTMAGPLTVTGGITSIPFNREYLSPPTTVVANQALSLSHGLGSVPKAIQVYWLVDIAELGYAVGDYIKIGDFAFSGAGADGIMVAMTGTLLKLRIGSVMPLVNNYSTGTPSRVATANGRLVVRAQI